VKRPIPTPRPGPVRIDPAGLYWAVLDGGRRPANEALRFAFEDVLPVEVERVHAVFRSLGDGRVLACGIDRERAAAIVGAGRSSATPADLPPWLGVHVRASSIELLVGDFLPTAARRMRGRAAVLSLIALVAAAAVLGAGFEHRRGQLLDAAAAADGRLALVVSEVLPPANPANAQPPALRLEAEVRSLRAAIDAAADAPPIAEASPALASVLGAWPDMPRCRTDLLSVTATTITLSTTLPGQAEARRLADALGSLPGWTPGQPQLASTPAGVQVRLELSRPEPTP